MTQGDWQSDQPWEYSEWFGIGWELFWGSSLSLSCVVQVGTRFFGNLKKTDPRFLDHWRSIHHILWFEGSKVKIGGKPRRLIWLSFCSWMTTKRFGSSYLISREGRASNPVWSKQLDPPQRLKCKSFNVLLKSCPIFLGSKCTTLQIWLAHSTKQYGPTDMELVNGKHQTSKSNELA